MYQTWREKQKKTAAGLEGTQTASPQATEETIPTHTRLFRGLFALFFVVVFAYVMREIFFGFGVGEEQASFFPLIIGVPGLALASWTFGKDVFTTTRVVTGGGEPAVGEVEVEPEVARKRMISIISWVLGFFFSIWFLGFVWSSVVATFIYLKVGSRENWIMSISLTALSWLFFGGLFDRMLHLPFPEGQLFIWLGY